MDWSESQADDEEARASHKQEKHSKVEKLIAATLEKARLVQM